jgi:hypothetical protein
MIRGRKSAISGFQAPNHQAPAHKPAAPACCPPRCEIAGDFVDLLVLEAILNVCRHDIADGHIRATANYYTVRRNIAVGDHADQTVILSRGQQPDVECRHRLGGSSVAVFRGAKLNVGGHFKEASRRVCSSARPLV